MIQLIHVTRRFGLRAALDDVTLSVDTREFVLLTGPTGAGKTTLLRLLHGDDRPSEGQVLVAGRDLARLRRSSLPLVRRNVGMVFQDFKLLPLRSALENVALALEVQGYARAEVRERSLGALERVGLAARAGAAARSLSGGEQQRVALARALVGEPEVLLCDEPTGSLDPHHGREVLDSIASAHGRGTTVVLATHDPVTVAFALAHGLRRLELREGRLEGGSGPRGLPVDLRAVRS